MKSVTDKMTVLQSRLSQDDFHLVRDLLSQEDTHWQKRLNRLPIVTPLLGAFGLVSTFYGFEKILDRTVLIEYPWFMLGMGVFLLLFTGVFYRKL